MELDRRRFGRQIRLAEIAEAGQARLCGARAPLTSRGFARTIEERYLRGAGLEIADEGEARVEPETLGLRHPAAAEVAEGALAALVAIRAVLGVR